MSTRAKVIAELMKTNKNPNLKTLDSFEAFSEKAFWVHTGSPELDFNIQTYGLPVGIIEISGLSKGGKTTLAMTGLKNFLDKNDNGIGIIISSERRTHSHYAARIGLTELENVLVYESLYVEDLFYWLNNEIDRVEEVFAKNKLGKPCFFIIWDSVGATNSRAEMTAFKENSKRFKETTEKGTKMEVKSPKIAAFAQQAKMCMKNVISQIYEKTMVFIAISHLYENVDGNGGTTSGGGKWIEYMPTMRLHLKRKEWISMEIDGKPQQVGQISTVYIEKSDYGSRRMTDIEICLGYGIVLSKNDIEYAIEKKIIKKESALKHSFMGDKLKWSSKREFYANYKNKNKFLILLHKRIEQERHKDVKAIQTKA